MAFSFLTVAVSNREVLAQEQPQQGESAEIIHPIPKVPIVVDGVKMAPEEIAKFNGQDLYYLVNDQARVLYIFTTVEGINRHANAESNSNLGLLSCDTTSDIYQNKYLSGTPYSFLNNDIESVQTTTCNAYTKLFDNTNFTGSQLWLADSGTTNDLGIYGWSNRAGSIRVDYY